MLTGREVTAALVATALLAGIGLAADPPAWGDVKPLAVEDLGSPLRTMRRAGEFVVPKPGGQGWWFITSYNPVSRNELPIQMFIVDLNTREVKRSERQPSGGFYESWSNHGLMGRDGRFYIGHYGKIGAWVFSPADGAMEYVDCPEIEERVSPGWMLAASDGKVYMGTASAKAYVVEFDPATRQFRNFGVQGPAHAAPRYIYYMAVSDTHVYSAAGKRPWYLVATDRKTMQQTVLMQDMDYLSVSGHGDECYASVSRETDGKRTTEQWYRLTEGQAVKCDPPAGRKREPEPPKPEVLLTRASPDSNGRAQVWFRLPGKEWASVDLEGIQTIPWKMSAIKALPDGRLLLVPDAYEDMVVHDPKTGRNTVLGKSPLSASVVECLGGKVFIGGYPGTYLVEYDPAKPWTFNTSTPTAKEPALADAGSNPRECGRLGEFTKTHHAMGSALGADGRIYLGGHAERLHVGGGLCWWDPAQRKGGGLREPFEVQDCAGLAAADDGRLIVYSSSPVADPAGKTAKPAGGKLFVFDTAQRAVAAELTPVPGMTSCGPVIGVGRRVLGIGRVQDGRVLYAVDLAERKTVGHKAVPGAPGRPRLGPDGKVYWFLDDVLVRVDPQTLAVEPIGQVEKPAAIEFVGNDMYLAGRQLRRVAGRDLGLEARR
jgi:hypothetical protein